VDGTLRSLKHLTTLLPLSIVEFSQKVTLISVARRKQSLDFVMRFVQICDVASELGILYNASDLIQDREIIDRGQLTPGVVTTPSF
jgi:hypothetical protein